MSQTETKFRHDQVLQRVERWKATVGNLQEKLTMMGKPHGKAESFHRAGVIAELNRSIKCLRNAKKELRELSGDGSVGDVKYNLIARCYVAMVRLEEMGTVVDDDISALLDEIERHVPIARLDALLAEQGITIPNREAGR